MSNVQIQKVLSLEQREELLAILKARFEKNMNRHKGIDWSGILQKLGGALFADRRYNHVFIYHNGASSYYGVRGFRGTLMV